MGGLCESLNVWKLVHPPFPIRNHRFHGGLLQHYFRNPNRIRIAGAAPGKIAVIGMEPFHDFGCDPRLRENRSAKTGRGASRSAVSYGWRLFMEHIEKSVDVDAPLSMVY